MIRLMIRFVVGLVLLPLRATAATLRLAGRSLRFVLRPRILGRRRRLLR
jgi:hypothetical protein